MKLHEYQSKACLRAAGVPVLTGAVVSRAQDVKNTLKKVGKGPWVIKAQIHTGGRGKAGGVKVVKTPAAAVDVVKDLIGRKLVTQQSGPEGLLVRQVLIEPAVKVERELYLAVTINRRTGRPVLMASSEGGVDIEHLAALAPEKIYRADIDPVRGLEAFQARETALAIGLGDALLPAAATLFVKLVKMFLANDAQILEINPLGIVSLKRGQKSLLAMDAKMSLDDNAAFRHADIFKDEDMADYSSAEKRAKAAGISYISLSGNIGCMVNGAGLAMATMDIIKLHGGSPANFLDVGGGANAAQVTEAFKILLSDKSVSVIFVNIFGGIMRCDVIAEGILQAVKKVGLKQPLVVRLEGNRVQEGRKILADAKLNIVSAQDLTDGAKKAVELSKRASANGDGKRGAATQS